MKDQQLSPAKLNTTQSILNSLCQRLLYQSQASPESVSKKQQLNLRSYKESKIEKIACSLQNPIHESLSLIQSHDQSPILSKPNLLTLNNQRITHNHNKSDYLKSQTKGHSHSYICCVLENQQIHDKLKKAKKNEFLLQSYREEVQYLKKLTFLQSEQIQKLRRLLRSQQDIKLKQKQLQFKHNSNCLLESKKNNQLKNNEITISENGFHDKIKKKLPRKVSHIKQQKVDKATKRKHSNI